MSSSLIEKGFYYFKLKKEVLIITYTTGLTVFNIAPGKKKDMYYNVCDSRCEAKRNTSGYRDFGSATAKKETRFDQFICQHVEKSGIKKLKN